MCRNTNCFPNVNVFNLPTFETIIWQVFIGYLIPAHAKLLKKNI